MPKMALAGGGDGSSVKGTHCSCSGLKLWFPAAIPGGPQMPITPDLENQQALLNAKGSSTHCTYPYIDMYKD